MMGKLLLLVALLFAAVAVLRVLAGKRSNFKPTPSKTPNPHSTASTGHAVQSLLPCPHCGVHMAQDEIKQHQDSQHSASNADTQSKRQTP
jgi:hypothetical protein